MRVNVVLVAKFFVAFSREEIMSRIARLPIPVPDKVEASVTDHILRVKGPLGELSLPLPKGIDVQQEGRTLRIIRTVESRQSRALSGTVRALAANMVRGVSQGFEKKLLLQGVGYRAQLKGQEINLELGFSHPVTYPVPDQIKVEMPTQTEIVIKGIDKQKVGQVAAEIRAWRPPEPYKGKGIRYADEVVILKETKKK
jgi:large subunit ribosomal protein L6